MNSHTQARRSNLYWLLVLPAYLVGAIVVPVLIHVGWDIAGFLSMERDLPFVREVLKSAGGGFCGVALTGWVAPSHKRATCIVFAIITVVGYTAIGLAQPAGALQWVHLLLADAGAILAVASYWKEN